MPLKNIMEAKCVNQEFQDGLYDFNESAEKIAEILGCRIVYPEANELQLDIDNSSQLNIFEERFPELCNVCFGYLRFTHEMHESKSGYPNFHVTIKVFNWDKTPHALTESERIALQFSLGSDPIRETLNSFRMLTGVKKPTRLFEKK